MKRNTLTTAVLAGLTGMAGMAGVANAVNVNPDGLGQVLLYPYYSAREGNNTLVSIVNTTNRGKAVKIRFIEALNSKEVLDFNIYMSPFDVWTAAVTDQGGTPGILIPDTTCTVPYLQGGEVEEVNGGFEPVAAFQQFLNFEFADGDGGPTDIERAASGYIEVIEMGTFVRAPESVTDATPLAEVVAWSINHVPDADSGVPLPNNCDIPVAAWTLNRPGDLGAVDLWVDGDTELGLETGREAQELAGGLFGAASIIDPASGFQVSYNPTAIDGFFNYAAGEDAGTLHTNPGDLEPDLTSGNNATSFVFNNGTLAEHVWQLDGVDFTLGALNAVLTQDMIMNEYLIDPALNAKTEWVLTMPTKRFHVSGSDPIPPFTRVWDTEDGGACEDFEFVTPSTWGSYLDSTGSRFFDREEQPGPDPVDPTGPVVSPRPATGDDEAELFQLCREANVIRFAQGPADGPTEIFGEPERSDTLTFTNIELPFSSGWVRLNLADVPSDSDVSETVRQSLVGTPAAGTTGNVVRGLPVIGFAASAIVNTNAQDGVLANYGSSFQHRGSRLIVDSQAD